jgi:high affinity sulfate transporter 1
MQSDPQSSALPPATRHTRTDGLRRWMPGLSIISRYNAATFSKDLSAGLVLTALLAPVGMGYAEATGLSPIYGLYATVIPLLIYAVFGPSRILVIGPDSALTALIAASVLPLAAGDPARAAGLAAVLAILAGVICMAAGLARMGFVTDLLSKPIRYGYLNGIALTLLVSQMPKLLGFHLHSGNLLDSVGDMARGVQNHEVNTAAFAIGTGCLVAIFACKAWLPRVPGVLVAVVGATLAVSAFDLAHTAHIAVVGVLPQGLPQFSLPTITRDEFNTLLPAALAIALVSIADMSVLSRIYAARGKYYVNENQEIMALGLANMATGLFQGFSVSSSASRTPVAEAAGAQTQMTGVVGAVCIALLLIFAPTLMEHLPTAALGAVVISAAWTILEVEGVKRLYQLRREEFVLSNVCFLGVALVGVIQGIFIAVAISLLLFFWHAWRPYSAVLGRVDGVKGYHDITRHPEARRIPGLVLFRWDAPLFFANAEMFRESVLRAVSSAPTPTAWLVAAAEPVTDVDSTAADVLQELHDELQGVGITLCFAQLKGPVKDRLAHYGLLEKIGSEHFFPTLGKSVDRYLDSHTVHWLDWEDAERYSSLES